MAPRTEVSDAERRQLQKLWAENPVGRTKLHAMARAAGLDITQRQVATFLKDSGKRRRSPSFVALALSRAS
jgi:protein involved in polysaccharide export with SLBB domain